MYLLMLGLIAILQAKAPGAPQAPDAGGLLGAGLFACVCPLVVLGVGLVAVIGMCKVFSKAGQPAWAALIPIYNNYVLCQIVKKPDWFIWTLIPCVNFYFGIVLIFETAKAFGKEGGFAVGLLLLPLNFWPILGFGSAEYQYGRGGRRRRREEEDEDDDDRPRRRARDEEEDEDEEDDRPRRRGRDEDDDDDEDDRRVKRRPRDDD
ncbi:MAG TPA: DUF5684 domain-containing protein [Gemmataceae bacterium]|nr:DUF5684 domain-containing protein [Gemmataceae bacterium]